MYTLKKASEHIYYEAWMFFNTSYLLSNVTDQTDINILLDAFAIHARNLFEFLYPKPTNQRKPDDIVVYDYINKQGFY